MEASNDGTVPDANVGTLREILDRWTVTKACLVLNEVESRLRLLAELRGKLDKVGADEVHELQPLFKRGLWMLGPQFESAEFTANLGMTRVVQRLFKNPLGVASRRRPDFVVLTDSSVGLYSCPSFNDGHEVDGSECVVVIELKTTGRRLCRDDREQVWSYIEELIAIGYIKPSTRVDGYIFGDQIARGEDRVTSYTDKVKIRPMLYDTILARAQSRLLNLYREVKNAPFLTDMAPENPRRPESVTAARASLEAA